MLSPRIRLQIQAIARGLTLLRAPGFWLALILAAALAVRLFYLTMPFEKFVSFFIADDFFYYLNTAVNIAAGHGSSFDGGLTHNNGYHPLFMILILLPLTLGMGKVGLVYWAMGILTLCTLVAIFFTYRLGHLWGNAWAALAVPVAIALNISFIKMSFSGFETMLAAALFLATLHTFLTQKPAWLVGALLGLTGLGRVEMLVLAIPLALTLLLQKRWSDLLIIGGMSLALMLPWFLWSYGNFGSPLPLSGVAKQPDRFQFTQLWVAHEHFCHHVPYFLGGYGLKWVLPKQATFTIGLLTLFVVFRNGRRFLFPISLLVTLFLLYGIFTKTHAVPQIIRYMVPAYLVLGALFFAQFSRFPRASRLLPLLVAILVVHYSLDFFQWSVKCRSLPTYVGLCQRAVPVVLDQIAREGDVVGCFDSGSMGYFSPIPVINLDGLVNAEIVTLQSQGSETWNARYRRYFAEKGITILAGGDRFSWIRYFPEIKDWEVLHAPIESSDGGNIVFYRVPPL